MPGGVHFRGGWAAGTPTANLHSRLASRVMLKIAHRPYRSEQDICALALEQRWEQWFSANETLRVDVTAIKSPLRGLEFTTLRVKDAICDRLREVSGARRASTRPCQDVRVFRVPHRRCAHLDTSGDPLFGAAGASTRAPRRCARSRGGYPATGWTAGTPLYDPMCGSGTFLAEAAQEWR